MYVSSAVPNVVSAIGLIVPVPNAGSDQSVESDSTVQLDGGSSSAPLDNNPYLQVDSNRKPGSNS